jgi:FtsP/CotA-like multicopper oxidase with cupredoxin domain
MRTAPWRIVSVLATAGTLMSASARAESVQFKLDMHDGKVAKELQTIRVHQGDAVELRWTSDKAVKVHLHGYDLQAAVKPGEDTVMAFQAKAAGRFSAAVIKEGPAGGGHGHGAAILYLEVHP